jgi:hypothetical protein
MPFPHVPSVTVLTHKTIHNIAEFMRRFGGAKCTEKYISFTMQLGVATLNT